MKITTKQLRQVIREELTQTRRRPGGARAALGFAIPEDSPEYGVPAPDSELKTIYDKAYALATKEGKLHQHMNPKGVASVLVSVLTRAMGYSYEDANHVLDQAQKLGFAANS